MSGLQHKYAGCPDVIGEIGGVRVIADFKTSNAPYMSHSRAEIVLDSARKYTMRAANGAYRYAPMNVPDFAT